MQDLSSDRPPRHGTNTLHFLLFIPHTEESVKSHLGFHDVVVPVTSPGVTLTQPSLQR
jgi:hypothetical protein